EGRTCGPPCAGAGDRRWVDGEGGRGRFQRVAGDGSSLVAPLAGGKRGGASELVVSVRSFEPSAPLARQLAPELAEAICRCRRQTGWGPRLVAGATGFCHSTVWKVLKRAGISRPARPAREPANSYEWPCPGDLLHMDTSEYVRFQRPGHRVTGDRSSQDRKHRDGVDYVH